jgi:hypothetical protein
MIVLLQNVLSTDQVPSIVADLGSGADDTAQKRRGDAIESAPTAH